MNRYFFLLTGLLICCYVPINDVTAPLYSIQPDSGIEKIRPCIPVQQPDFQHLHSMTGNGYKLITSEQSIRPEIM